MDADGWVALAFLILGLGLLSFASLANTAFASLGHAHSQVVIENTADGNSIIGRLLRRPRMTASALVVIESLATVLVAAPALYLMTSSFGLSAGALAVFATGIFFAFIIVHLVFGAVATLHMQATARLAAYPVALIVAAITPFAFLGRSIGGSASPRDSLTEPAAADGANSDPLGSLPGQENAGEDERRMIKGVFDLEQTSVSQIMVPRVDIAAIEVGSPFKEVVDFVIEQGYSRIPLYEETLDNILGIVYAKDLLKTLCIQDTHADLRKLAHQALFVPEYKKIDELLREFRHRKVHMAIVVDEYGGTEGLVTIEDLLEQIVGEIEDEYDTEESEVTMVNDHEAIVDARVSVDDINDIFGLKVESEDFDTIGGLLSAHLGKIPRVGDAVETDGLAFEVLSASAKRAKKVRVIKIPSGEEAGKPD